MNYNCFVLLSSWTCSGCTSFHTLDKMYSFFFLKKNNGFGCHILKSLPAIESADQHGIIPYHLTSVVQFKIV